MRGRAGLLGLLCLALLAAGTAMARGSGWRWDLPPGIEPPPVPAGNPMNAAKVALGRRLFHDGRLSAGGTMSCATCHQQDRAFASATVTHPGIGGTPGRRNVPGLANVGWLSPLTWHDPGVTTLEAQVATPLFGTDPVEMAARPGEIVARIRADACYRRLFRAADPASGGRIDLPAIANALAAFQRTLIAYGSPHDRWRRGDRNAMPRAALRGAEAFSRSCTGCHSGPNFTDGKFHAIGAADPEDRGLAESTGIAADEGKFRTAPLRNAALTAPYLHDGSAPTLAGAIRRHRQATDLDAGTVDDLIAFLGTLSDQGFVTNPAFGPPPRQCEIKG